MSNANLAAATALRTVEEIDALNRAAIATGSVRNARISSDADFNGHPATLKWNTFIGSWQAYYSWSGIQYIVRAEREGLMAPDAPEAYASEAEWREAR